MTGANPILRAFPNRHIAKHFKNLIMDYKQLHQFAHYLTFFKKNYKLINIINKINNKYNLKKL